MTADTVRAIDALFVRLAGQAAEPDRSCDDVVEDLWALFESGNLRLVIDRDELRVEPVVDDDERRRVAEYNRPFILARRAPPLVQPRLTSRGWSGWSSWAAATSSITERLAHAAVLARKAPASITRCISTTAGRGVRLLRDFEPRLRRYRLSLLQPMRHGVRAILVAERRRAGALRKLSPDLISKAMDETAAQVTRIGLTFFGMAAFCFLSLFSPDSALLGGSEKINVPLVGSVSFSGFMLLGPAFLILLRLYLQIYVEHGEQLDRLARSMSIVRSPTLILLDHPLIRFFSAVIFYLLLPLIMLFFAWKAAVFPAWGSGLLAVAAGVVASHVMLPLKTCSWPSKALLSTGAAIVVAGMTAGFVITGFGPVRRPFELERASLSGQWLVREDLRGANLYYANLTSADLTGADLSGAGLELANLSGANLSGANLFGAHLTGAYLFGAHLTGADLSDADLTGAHLSGANLEDADLTDANLSDADLSGAKNLTQGQLDTACGNADTKLPEGLKVKDCPPAP